MPTSHTRISLFQGKRSRLFGGVEVLEGEVGTLEFRYADLSFTMITMIARAKTQLLHLANLVKKREFKQLSFELFKKSHPSSLIKLFRYLFVAAAAYAVDFGLLIILVSGFGVHYLIAATISFTFGVCVNYLLSHQWVFPKSRYRKHTEIAGVLTIGIIGLVLNNILLALFTEHLGLFYVYSKIIATAFVFFWNFFARHIFLRPAKKPSV